MRDTTATGAFDWRTADPAAVDDQYSPSRHALRPIEEHLAEYRERGRGLDPGALVARGRPLLVYIHGGYWQMLSAADSLFAARDAVAEGVGLHAVEYTLAPTVTIEEIIEECVGSVVAVIDRLAPSTVVLAGSSAGAHLSAMCARDPRLAGRLDGLALLSGVFDLRPLVVTPTNDALGLDEARASALSPQLSPAPRSPRRVLCAVGGHESSEFIRQTAEYARHLRAAGLEVRHAVVAHRDHFDLPFDLLARGTVVGDWVLEVLGATDTGGGT